LQHDESTGISEHAQLSVRFVDKDTIGENFLFCNQKKQLVRAFFVSRQNILNKEGLKWKNCLGVCTEGAAAMAGRNKGFVSRVKERNPDVIITHCLFVFNHEALVAKT